MGQRQTKAVQCQEAIISPQQWPLASPFPFTSSGRLSFQRGTKVFGIGGGCICELGIHLAPSHIRGVKTEGRFGFRNKIDAGNWRDRGTMGNSPHGEESKPVRLYKERAHSTPSATKLMQEQAKQLVVDHTDYSGQ